MQKTRIFAGKVYKFGIFYKKSVNTLNCEILELLAVLAHIRKFVDLGDALIIIIKK